MKATRCNLCGNEINQILEYHYPFYMRPADREDLKHIKVLPLKIAYCDDCKHFSQINPPIKQLELVYKKLYKNYNDTSSSQMVNFLHFIGRGKTLLEIGCSGGNFLNLAKSYGYRVYGCDPSPLTKESENIKRSVFKKNLFRIKFDKIVARHVLEHIVDLKKFFKDISSSLNGELAIEVPNVSSVLKNCYIGAFSHEHINYFTTHSLNSLMNSQGFTTKRLIEHETSIYWSGHKNNYQELIRNYKIKTDRLVSSLNRIKQPVYIYGAGGHTVSLLSKASLNIKGIIDNDENKAGKSLKGFEKIQIYTREKLKELSLDDIVIISSEIFQEEIYESIKDFNFKIIKLYK